MTTQMRFRIAFAVTVVILFVENFAAPDPAWQLRLIDDQGLDDPTNTGVGRMFAHGGWCFLASWNVKAGVKVYRSKDAENWERISEGGINGNTRNFTIAGFTWFDGLLYAGTWNQMEGASMFRANADAPNASDIKWETVALNGFDNPRNTGFTHMRAFKGHLYAGCFNFVEGSEVWRSESGDPGSWAMVIPKGWNAEFNTDSTMMIEHDGYLYVGTESARDSQWEEGAQLWRTDGNLSRPYDQWQQVNVNGFGDGHNHNICGLAVLEGKLYAGTWNQTEGPEVWRATLSPEVPFKDWEKVVDAGFNNKANIFTCQMVNLNDTLFLGAVGDFATTPPLYFLPNAKLQRAHGGLLIKSTDGTNWQAIDQPGFMDPPQIGVQWLATFKTCLLIGGMSIDDTMELWVYEPLANSNE